MRWFTPPNYPNYELKIPKGTREKFISNADNLKSVMISGVVEHRLRWGETLSHVADAYKTSVGALMSFNGIKNPRRLRAGSIIRVPIRTGHAQRTFTYAQATPSEHTLREGETLSHVSEAYGVSVSDLIEANDISNARALKAGQTIKIPSGSASYSHADLAKYTLKRGETLSHVADLYRTSVSSLLALNNIDNPRTLKEGQEILIPSGARPRHNAWASAKPGIDTDTYKKMINEDGAVGYTVKSGDTIWSISRAFNVTVSEIRKWNRLGSVRMIHPGDKLVIYPRFINGTGDANESPVSLNQIKTAKFHKVRRGDTLWDISKTYNIPVNQLISMNKLEKSVSIKPGDMLKLSN